MGKYLYIILSILSLCSNQITAQTQNTYNLGDIIDIQGHKAIVFKLNESSTHGTAMYVKALRGIDKPWCNSGKHSKSIPRLINETDGYSNTKQVIKYAIDSNAISNFPAFDWCHKLGDGWYIPSVSELEEFINFWLGNNNVLDWDDESMETSIDDDNSIYYKTINNKLLDAGGSPFLNGVYTSTENESGKIYVFQFDKKKNTWKFTLKSKTGLGEDSNGRAFIQF